MSLKGKNILITGGTSPLGSSLAETFAKNGANVAIHCNRSERKARLLAQKLSLSYGIRACHVKGDIKNVSDIKRFVKKASRFLGSLDIVINNAGIFQRTPARQVDLKDWNNIIDINLRGTFFVSITALPFFSKTGGCHIINIADTYGSSPSAEFVPYGISKAGVIALTKGLAKELAPNILVNCICPGIITLRPGKHNNKAIKTTLLRQPVKIKDFINTVLFLALNDSMTAQDIFVDGGKTT